MRNCTECNRESTNQTATQTFPIYTAALRLGISSIVVLTTIAVLIIFLKSKSVRANRHHNLVICLSISDVTYGLSGIIASFRLLIPACSGAFILCIIAVVLLAVAVFMSLFQTFLISFHRYLVAVGSTWNDRLFKGKRKYIIYVISWSIVPPWLFAFVSPILKSDVRICNMFVILGGNIHIFSCVYGVLVMVLLISTILLYIFTVNSVRKRYMRTFAWQMENRQSEAGHTRTENSSNENNLYITEIGKKKVFESLKVVGIVIALLIVFKGPFVTIIFMVAFNFLPSHNTIFAVCAFTSLNSALNPFVYSWKIDTIRKEFKRVSECVCKGEQD